MGDPALARVGLAEAAEAFVVAARQYGADLDTARAALDAAWHRL